MADLLWIEPWRVFPTADSWQRQYLHRVVTVGMDVLACCARGAGKSEVAGCAAYLDAVLYGGFSLICSRSDRQAMELMGVVRRYAFSGNGPELRIVRKTAHELAWENGGRVLAVPCREDTVRGLHKVSLLILDEAARVPDEYYGAMTPSTKVPRWEGGSAGVVTAISTPYGQRGWYWREWSGLGEREWSRYEVPWQRCPRLHRLEVDRERRRHGDLWVQQEYECRFLPTSSGVFSAAAFAGAIDPGMPVLSGW